MKPIAFRSKRPSFFQKHAQAVSIVGLVILLVTFLVREVSREQLAELRDSISEAQRVVDMGSTTEMSQVQQLKLMLELRQLKSMTANPSNTEAVSAANLWEECNDVVQQYANAGAHLDRVSAMLDKLPPKADSLRKDREDLRKQYAALGKDVNDTVAQHRNIAVPIWRDHVLVLLELFKVELFELGVVLWEDSVVTFATNLKTAAQRLYDFCTYTSYVLYILGWFLTLGGQIAAWRSTHTSSASRK